MPPILGILLFLGVFLSTPTLCEQEPSMLRFELLHRHGPQLLLNSKTQSELVRQLVRSDEIRSQMIPRVLSWRRRATEISCDFQMPISSGAYAGTGQYFVEFHVGTPEQTFLLVADTGSDLTWMSCNSAPANPIAQVRRTFKRDQSSTFKPIPCSSNLCKTTLPFALTKCPTPESPCAYDYRYSDGSLARGYFANESATVTLSNGQKTKFEGIIIGCTNEFTGISFIEANGVLGLGHSQNSFTAQAIEKYGGKFSYCLVDHLSPREASNYLTFGLGPSQSSAMKYAKLVIDEQLEPFYGVEVTEISADGTMLRIPTVAWDVKSQGGVILDSGTSLTILSEPAYVPVMEALTSRLEKFPKVENEEQAFEFCFNATAGYTESVVPKLAVHFADSVVFEPPVKSYVIDVAPQVKCLGFMRTAWPGTSIIGNIFQQSHKWEFDIRGGRLGFEPSTCA